MVWYIKAKIKGENMPLNSTSRQYSIQPLEDMATWIVSDAELALKSPTKTTASPAYLWHLERHHFDMEEITGLECCVVILFGTTVVFLVVWGHAGCGNGI